MRRDTADIAVERQAAGICRRLGHRHAGAENGIGSQAALVRRAVESDHRKVDVALVLGIEGADQQIADFRVHRVDRLGHAFAEIALAVTVAQFDRFMRPGRCAARHRGPAEAAVVEQDIDFYRGISARVEDFAGVNVDDRGHGW